MPHAGKILAMLVAAAVVCGGADGAANGSPDHTQGASPLVDHLEAFFRSDEPAERAVHLAAVEKATGGDVDVVASALQDVRLWAHLPSRTGALTVDSESGCSTSVSYLLPPDYDPARRYPLILCMPDGSESANETLAFAASVLRLPDEGVVLICPQCKGGSELEQRAAIREQLPSLLRRTRTAIHTDSNRVYLFGAHRGGDAAWNAVIEHSDLFAGAILYSGYPNVPYPAQLYPLLLENVRHVPILTVWVSADGLGVAARQQTVAARNRGIVEFAQAASLPITGIELSHETPLELLGSEVAKILGRVRQPAHRQVSHWSWHPASGGVDWLMPQALAKDVWDGDQLAILASGAIDRDTFIRGVLEEKLAYVGGRIDGGSITVEAKRCGRVELLLPPDVVDFSRRITISCNGRIRHDGLIQPSIKTLLDTAYENWEFQRLVAARIELSVGPDRGGR